MSKLLIVFNYMSRGGGGLLNMAKHIISLIIFMLNEFTFFFAYCSGDHDLVVSHVSTEAWIRTLFLTVDYPWRPWFVDGQVAG